jgi:serine/threonine protein kinase, bacterial
LSRAAALVLGALAAGCSSGTSVDLTIQLAGDVAARAGEIASMELHVDGDAAPFARTLDVRGKFGSGRETLRYRPGVSSGTLTFNVTLRDAGGNELGSGSASTPLSSGSSVPLTVPVGAGVTVGDMGPPPDLVPPCTGITVSTLAGTGIPGYTDGPGNMAQFQLAKGITADAQGTLYVAEAKHVRKVLADGTTSTLSSGVSGGTQFLGLSRIAHTFGDFWVIDVTNDTLFRISGTQTSVVLLSGALNAVGANPTNSKIYTADTQTCDLDVVNFSTTMLDHFSGVTATCGSMDGTAATAQFSTPRADLVFDATGKMYVADLGNLRIRAVAADGSVTTLAGSTQGHTDAVGAAAQFDNPTGIAVDNQRQMLYVADNTTIRAVTFAGGVTTLVGSVSGFVDGNGCVARFGKLDGIVYFAGALYAVDIERIRKIVLP